MTTEAAMHLTTGESVHISIDGYIVRITATRDEWGTTASVVAVDCHMDSGELPPSDSAPMGGAHLAFSRPGDD
jgi:hypothetical protein